jgi:hypothetical protein
LKIPSIKGIAFKSVVEDVARLADGGRIAKEELKRILTHEDLDFLEQPILDSKWYPLASYQRMMRLLRDTEGKGKNAYLRGRGARTAQRLLDSGIYQQLRYAGRMATAKTREDAVGHVKLIATLWNGMFNVGDWRVYLDKDRLNEFGIDIRDAEQIPDLALEAIAGFIDRIVRCNDVPTDDVTFKRLKPDVVRLKIILKEGGG